MKQLINRFNNQNTFLVISDYPEKSLYGEKNYGIAWHTKELLEPIAKKYNAFFVVLAEKGDYDKPEIYQNGKILVLRVFDSNNHTLYPTVLKWLNIFNKIKKVHVHSEFCANGGIINQILLIPFLMLIKITKKQITYFSHNVVTTLNDIAPHLNLKNGSLIVKILNICLKYYYKTLNLFVDNFVVMDEVIFKRLSSFINDKKITLIPFWIKKRSRLISKNKAKKLLGFNENDRIILYFGFITYYKGADWIIRTFKQLKNKKEFRKLHLVMAGGPAYSLKNKPYYKTYFEKVIKSIKSESNIHITGFVPESMVDTYFASAECVVFPYRGLIGGSATLIKAITYQKPFILSRPMKELLENSDFEKIFIKNKVDASFLTFEYNCQSFYKTYQKTLEKKWIITIKDLINDITNQRSAAHWIINCYNKLYNQNEYAKKAIPKAKLAITG